MKDEKDLRNHILSSLSEEGVPDLRGNIKLAYHELEEKKKKKKKSWLGWALGIGVPVAAAVILGIAIPLNLSSSGSNPVNSEDINSSGGIISPSIITPSERHEDVAFGISSGGSFLSTEAADASFFSRVAYMAYNAANAASSDDIKTHLEDVNPFMMTAERMMNGYELISEITYDESSAYPYSMTLEGGAIFSYKETSIVGKENDEESFNIEGELSYEGSTYSVSGKREIESGTNETEAEIKFNVKLSDSTYLILESENEVEANETEESYSYKYVENGVETLDVSLSYEVENNQEEMSIEVTTIGKEAEYIIIPGANSNSFSLQYEFEVETGGNEQEAQGSISVSISEDEAYYVYTYNGTSLSLPRK